LKNEIIQSLNSSGQIDSAKIINYLEFVNINKDNSFFSQFNDFLNDYLKRNTSQYEILNEGIHSLHRIYLKNDYINNLRVIDDMCKLTNNFIKEINLSAFNVLNQKIISMLQENN
jgi:tryptophan synthase beta subunit